MRKARRRWLGLLVPLLGIGAAFARPPLDDYAPLDRIGTRYEPTGEWGTTPPPGASASARAMIKVIDDESQEWTRAVDERTGVGRRRGWKIHAPEAEARRTIGRLFSARGRWTAAGVGTTKLDMGSRRRAIVTTAYVNGETGDEAHVEFETPVAPTRGPASITVMVTQSEASLQPRALVRRWWRRLIGP